MITHISPLGSMDLLSQLEVDVLKRTASSHLYRLYRNCSLAVLNSGSQMDNSHELLSRFRTLILTCCAVSAGKTRTGEPAAECVC